MRTRHDFFSQQVRLSLLVLALWGSIPAICEAQRHIKGQRALMPYIGVVDNLHQFNQPVRSARQGYVFGLDMTRYTVDEKYWKIGYQYDVKYYQSAGATLSTDRHTVSFEYALASFHDHRRRFYVSPLLGVHGGFERVNRNRLELDQGRILNQPTGLIGLQAGVEGEYFVGEHLALVGAVQERYLPYSHVTRFRTYGTLGLRYSFFTN